MLVNTRTSSADSHTSFNERYERLSSVLTMSSRLAISGKRFLSRRLGSPRVVLTVLYNSAPGPAKLGSRMRPALNKTEILFLGRIGPRKGVPELLLALSRLQPSRVAWSITIAGDGDIAEAKQSASELGILDQVRFTGWVDPTSVQGLLMSCDILVLPSHAEGSPMVVVEAFAYGVAVIVSPVGAIPEIVVDRENGLLVEAGNVEELTRSIESLCVDREYRERLASAGRRTWEDRLSIDIYAQRLGQIWTAARAGRA